MASVSAKQKAETFNFRIEPGLKHAFTAAAAKADRPAAQLLREFMRAYVKQRERASFEADAKAQSGAIAERSRDPKSDEAAVMRELDAYMDSAAFADLWKA